MRYIENAFAFCVVWLFVIASATLLAGFPVVLAAMVTGALQ